MKKDLNTIISGIVDNLGSENISIQDNTYFDNYFETGFTCPGVFVGFNFFTEEDRKKLDKFIKAISRKKSLCYTVIKNTGYVAGISIRYSSDMPILNWIESARIAAHDSYWEYDHKLRNSGVSDTERITLMKCYHFENVSSFLSEYSKLYKIA